MIGPVVTLGFGPGASVALVVLLGFGTPPPVFVPTGAAETWAAGERGTVWAPAARPSSWAAAARGVGWTAGG